VVLQRRGPGADLDATGTTIGAELLARILQALQGDRDRPLFGHLSFTAATFTDGADFAGAEFAKETSFENAHFNGPTSFKGTQFADDVFFDCAQFSGPTSFEGKYSEIL
jgi:Pentapeptide repeats (9 copies)